MTLCKTCSSLVLEELWNADFVLHENLQALIHSAESGCTFCNLCWVQIQRERTWDVDLCLAGSCNGMGGKTIVDPTIYLQAHWQMPNSEQNVPSRLWISCGPLPNSSAEGLTSQGLSTSLCIFADPGTPAESLFEERYITVDHNPNGHIAWTQRALDFCQRNHKVCEHASRSAPRQMPTRIIDVGPVSSPTSPPTQPPRLVLAKDLPSPEPYTALSYCWGQGVGDKLELRRHTLATLLTHMPLASLTRTHQDAIRFTRALGIRYLWIDALCILQGDPADWARESKRMGSVYGGAYLTIIASRASDSADGFLANSYRTASQNLIPAPCPLPCGASPLARAGPALGTVYVTAPRSTAGGPVDARGWCFQESLLAHRAISFGTEQLLYSCRTAKRYEDGDRSLVVSGSSFRRLAGPDPGPRGEVLRSWYAMLQNFSPRALTEPHDVFACIASLALVAHRVLRCRYLAGLWEADIPRGLVWRSQFRYFLPIKTAVVRPRASGFRMGEGKGEVVRRAPSWSWASVQGPVVWPAAVLRGEVGVDLFVRPREAGGWTVDDGVGEPDALYMPWLELRMWARPVRVRRGGRTTGEYAAALSVAGRKEWKAAHTKYGMLLEGFESGGVVAVGYFDVLGEEEPENMWCLRIVKREGILLTRDEQEKFHRIGWLAVLEEERWFGRVGEQAVDLV
ncbi:heterokaryon incompatibility protein-domain-containing protein [Podospora appendiculata]|uniref:Heterokaryon incompatibility protein-domain-containing protein n=1 Tax=Podospora appendiculata TaxID=314037 RepID=A0AAE1C7I9_9PEZI|nr:heterokaryon incompatibility protein-domain-containing protein [Podospora appendiculata]